MAEQSIAVRCGKMLGQSDAITLKRTRTTDFPPSSSLALIEAAAVVSSDKKKSAAGGRLRSVVRLSVPSGHSTGGLGDGNDRTRNSTMMA